MFFLPSSMALFTAPMSIGEALGNACEMAVGLLDLSTVLKNFFTLWLPKFTSISVTSPLTFFSKSARKYTIGIFFTIFAKRRLNSSSLMRASRYCINLRIYPITNSSAKSTSRYTPTIINSPYFTQKGLILLIITALGGQFFTSIP